MGIRPEDLRIVPDQGPGHLTGEVGVLFLSTGPGALTSLAGLQEAYATGVPMVVSVRSRGPVASRMPTCPPHGLMPYGVRLTRRRPSAARTTHSAVRLLAAWSSTRRSAQRAG